MTDSFKPFGGLPITEVQDAEIRAYIERCNADGICWDTLELDYMLAEMLFPPPADDRIDICEQFAHKLASHPSHPDDIYLSYEKLDSATRRLFTASEWRWITREAQIVIARRGAER